MTVRVAFGPGDGGAVGDGKAEGGGMLDEMVARPERIHIACAAKTACNARTSFDLGFESGPSLVTLTRIFFIFIFKKN